MSDSRFDGYIPSPAQTNQAEALLKLLKECDEQGIQVCVFGGYGLDSLYGRLTRDHGDFDLIVETNMQPHLAEVLKKQDYEHMPAWDEPGRKTVYIHPALAAPFKVEVATLDETKLDYAAQAYGISIEYSILFPATPNGRLFGYPIRTPTPEGVELVNKIQQMTGVERGWDEFTHLQHQQLLLRLLKSR